MLSLSLSSSSRSFISSNPFVVVVAVVILSTLATCVNGEKIQAENAAVKSKVVIDDKHPGFEGLGYADYDGFGSFLTFNYDAQLAGEYDITIRYAARVARQLDLVIDDVTDGPIAESVSGDWNLWTSETRTISLNQGSHTIKLLASISTGPNVDWLSIEYSGVVPPIPAPIPAPVPAPVPPPPPGSADIYEAEDADVKSNVDVENLHSGFSGSGYGDYGSFGANLVWNNVLIPEAGDYEVTIHYASKSDRPLQLVFDDGLDQITFSCFHTGEWDNWVEEVHTITLSRSGTHTLKLVAQYSTGPNVDWISLKLAGGPRDTPLPPPTPSPIPAPIPQPTLSPIPAPVPQPTPAPIPAPTPANTDPVLYTPNQADLHKVAIMQSFSGYQNEGYGDYQDSGSYMKWDVNAPVSANYEVKLRYAAKSDRPVDLFVDDKEIVEVEFETTGDWSVWKVETIVVYLEQGIRELKFLAVSSPGPNLNWMKVRPQSGAPQPAPTPAPIPAPVPAPTGGVFPESTVLGSNQRLERNQFVESPNGDFKVGLTNGGDLVLRKRNNQNVWSAGVSGGFRCFMQTDGNLIVRDINNRAKWVSNTYDHPGAQLTVDDGGRIAVMVGDQPIWMDGIPRAEYKGPSSTSLQYPIRGVFYYPWYPETWTVNGEYAHFEPDIGFYSSSDTAVAENHIDAFEYAHVDLSIASWWGPETNLDRARLTMLMDQTIKLNSKVKWTVYHEDEREYDPSPVAIREDLDYLKKWFAWHPGWAHIEGKPVIFVYNEGGCEVADRWMAAADGEWFVVLKLFGGYTDCPTQPSAWHQYGVGNGYLEYDEVSVTLAPGFWRADRDTPDFPRVPRNEWCDNVEKMVESEAPFQLIVSFNEAGEGTMIEASSAWQSSSGYGYYLDCLNQFQH